MKSTKVIQINLDLRLLAAIALTATLLVVTYLTIQASGAWQQSSPNDPNEITPTASVEQVGGMDVPLSGSPNGDFTTEEAAPGTLNPAAIAAVSAGGSSSSYFYLTNFNRPGNTALTACAAGYHMASMWELADISNLTYDNTNPNAYNKTDSGQGPPSLWYGWVRTGYDSSGVNTAGVGNCLNWTTTVGTNYGTIVRLTNNWDVDSGALSPWEADPWACSGIAPVWCVGD